MNAGARAPVTTPIAVAMSRRFRLRFALRSHIRAGDTLMLKSGGPPMTAIYVGPVVFARGVWVTGQWFDTLGQLRQEMFPRAALRQAAAYAGGAPASAADATNTPSITKASRYSILLKVCASVVAAVRRS